MYLVGKPNGGFDGGERHLKRSRVSGIGSGSTVCFDPFLFSWLIGAESRLTRYPETRTWTAHDRQDIAGLVLFGATGIDCKTRPKVCSKNSVSLCPSKISSKFFAWWIFYYWKKNRDVRACRWRVKKRNAVCRNHSPPLAHFSCNINVSKIILIYDLLNLKKILLFNDNSLNL